MTNTEATPPGWYPDSSTAGQLRWWDGTQWTDRTQTPYTTGPGGGLAGPSATATNTTQIWAIVGIFALQLVVTLAFLATFDWTGYIAASANPSSPLDVYGYLFTPGYIATLVTSFVVYGATAALAYFDSKQLAQRGVQRPFHWALSFIPSYGSMVYVIGRSVVVRRRTGGGLGPLWAYIAVFVVGTIASLVVVFSSMASMFDAVSGISAY